MSTGRELWTSLKGSRFVVGTVSQSTGYGERIIYTKTNRKISSSHPAFLLLESLLIEWGYAPEIRNNGAIEIVLPIRDEYGRICREIAKTYWLALTDAGYTQKKIKELCR